MDTIIGIDLGTTNSAVCLIQDGKPVILKTADGQSILPSVVGMDSQGQLLVGQAARNQAVLAPERTVRSVKRKMGQSSTISMGDATYTPQEISAMILRTLKDQAARALGRPVTKAVITVPAFFNETQREATRQAGELAGLEVLRIINEPTAASLIYEARSE
ncbi:MAG: Hsp70 family protein, partial [Planctomycetes bacterium]|nr:Hsp70 family protein [Planctomycetota bacterium]